MVNRILKLFNRDFNGLHEAAFLLGLASFVSKLLALLRDRLFASTFGAGETLDIYYASFRVPDVFYVFVASLVAAAVLIPFIIEKLEDSKKSLNYFINNILTFFSLFLIFSSVVFYFFIPVVSGIIVPGFTEEARETFITLSRILLISPFLLGLSNLFGSINQAFRKFFVYAMAPVLYNIGIIIGILFFYKPLGMNGLAYGVVLGAFLHFVIQVPPVLKEKIIPHIIFKVNFKEIKEVLILSVPRTITLSVYNITILVFVSLASLVGEGSISVFNLSYNLQSVPLAIIGVSYSVAAFPTLSKLFLSGNKELFAKQVATAGRHIIFWSLPVLSIFIVLRAHIVRVILGAGKFNWEDTRLTAAALSLFAFSVAAQGLILLFVRGYYAAGNTKKPLVINVASSLISIVMGFLFLYLFDVSLWFRQIFETVFRVEALQGTKVLMLPLAFSLGSIINMFVLWGVFRADFKGFYISVRQSVFQSLAGSIIMGVCAYLMLHVLDFNLGTFMGVFLQGFLSGLVGFIIGVLFLKIIRNRELKEFEGAMKKRFWKRKPVVSELGEL